MADKEVRFGIANTALWATATTDASNGSVNGGHDALTAGGGAVPLVNIFLGEVIFGGVGSGLYGMFFYIVHRRLRRRADGRPHAGVPGQEDRGARDQVRRGRRAVRADDGADPDGGLGRDASPGSRRSSTPARTASPRRSTPTRRSRTTTAAPSPATARRASRPTLGTVALLPRPLRAAARGARARRLARRARRSRPASAGTFRTDGADVRRAARRRDRAHRRPDDLPGADARADRRRAVALMLRDLKSSVIAVVVLTLVFGLGYPALMTGFAAGRLPEPGERQPDQGRTARSSARRLAAQASRSRSTSTSGRPRPRPPYNAGAHDLREPRPDEPRPRQGRPGSRPRRSSKLERPYNPGLTIHDIPVDAVTTSGSGIDPDISPAYAQLQARRVAAVRHLPLATVQQLIDEQHRRPLASASSASPA